MYPELLAIKLYQKVFDSNPNLNDEPTLSLLSTFPHFTKLAGANAIDGCVGINGKPYSDEVVKVIRLKLLLLNDNCKSLSEEDLAIYYGNDSDFIGTLAFVAHSETTQDLVNPLQGAYQLSAERNITFSSLLDELLLATASMELYPCEDVSGDIKELLEKSLSLLDEDDRVKYVSTAVEVYKIASLNNY